MKVGEHKLVESAQDDIKVHVFHCPWHQSNIGAASTVAFAATVGEQSIEIVNAVVKIDGVQVTTSQSYSDGTTIGPIPGMSMTTGWLIQGPPNTHGRAQIKLKRRFIYPNLLPAGYDYDTFIAIPRMHAGEASGLCQSQANGELPSKECAAGIYESMFKHNTLESLDQICFGESSTGIEECEFDPTACVDAASCCLLNNRSLVWAQSVCSNSIGVDCDHHEHCVHDLCITGHEDFVNHHQENCLESTCAHSGNEPSSSPSHSSPASSPSHSTGVPSTPSAEPSSLPSSEPSVAGGSTITGSITVSYLPSCADYSSTVADVNNAAFGHSLGIATLGGVYDEGCIVSSDCYEANPNRRSGMTRGHVQRNRIKSRNSKRWCQCC